MSEETVMIHCSWDSGPFATWSKADTTKSKIEGPNGFGTNTVPIPVEIWEQYLAALEVLGDAESALDEAEQAFLDVARKSDPRWQR